MRRLVIIAAAGYLTILLIAFTAGYLIGIGTTLTTIPLGVAARRIYTRK